MDIKILVAAHKDYPMPNDEVYLPVQVGCAVNGHLMEGSGKFIYDDSGDNISALNPYYCELTALYWGWKNLHCDYLGLVHYRRHFTGKESADMRHAGVSGENTIDARLRKIMSGSELKSLLDKLSKESIFVILPKKRNYYIETLYSHYAHSHHEADLIAMTDVIHNHYPEYTHAYIDVIDRRSAHMFNMCIMKKDIADAYCSWLFDVLTKIQSQLDISKYTDFDKRVFGRISELLLDVWITKNNIRYYEQPVFNLEGENWIRKIPRFIRRKIKAEHDN